MKRVWILTETQIMDAEIVEKMKCQECGWHLVYEAWVDGDSYHALGRCPKCGKVVEV